MSTHNNFTTKTFDQEKMQKCICILCPHSNMCDLKNAVDHTDPNNLCEVQLKDNIIGRKNIEVIALYEWYFGVKAKRI